MKSKNIPADIKSKSIKEAQNELIEIINNLENTDTNLEESVSKYNRMMHLNTHIQDKFKRKLSEIRGSKYKNKFQHSGKWFPYMIQLLGTNPEAVKISQTREYRKAKSNSENIFDPNDINVDKMADADDGDLERLRQQDYRKKYLENFPREIPDYQINFFIISHKMVVV